MTAAQLLSDAVRALAAGRSSEEALRDAQILLGFVLDVPRSWLSAHREDPIDPEAMEKFRTLVSQRSQGHPIAYLTGRREFYGLDFQVTPAVLIPRPETELLVDAALEVLPENQARDVLDLGTGSGCVAVAIAHQRPLSRVSACDRSVAALSVAGDNARQHGVAVEFIESDWFQAIGGRRFDLIVANPPYVAEGDSHLSRGDLRFEPISALSAGPDGLSDLRRIVGTAPDHLNHGGWLMCEHGYDQAEACRKLMLEARFREVFTRHDLAGLPRISGGRLLTGKTPNR